jgi:enediyne biosynthesis protein E4
MIFRNKSFSAFVILCCCFFACKKGVNGLFEEISHSNIEFTNALNETDSFNVFKYRNFYNGGGVATGDINNDGLPDIFFTANQGPNKLYLNRGNFEFEDISENAGFGEKPQWSTGVVFVDINNDGWLDVYVCNAGHMMDSSLRRNQLFINNKDLTFSEKASEYGLDDDGYTTHAAFFDYDLDGDLDCFIVNNSPIPVNTLNYANSRQVPASQAPVAPFLRGGGDHLYKNNNGYFEEVTQEAGIYGSLISFGLGVNIGDINGDMYPDIYVSNDFFEKDYLYINQRDGTFKDELEQRIQHISLSSMGADIQDINNDGHQDIFTTDMLPGDDYRLKTNTSFESYDVLDLKRRQGFYHQFTQNALQVNDGSGNFFETAFYSGVAASDWSWGALIFDADNDGLSDIVVCNGIYRDVTDQDFIDFFANDVMQRMVLTGKKEEVQNIINKMPSVPIPNEAFRNTGNLKFENASEKWGLNKPGFSNGAAYADLDNDGDLDLVINNVNQKALVYKNKSRELNNTTYIAFALKYQSPNVFGIGSKIRLFSNGEIIIRELYPSRGFQSSVEYKLTIGLGNLIPDSAQIIWPDSSITSINNPKVNQLHQVAYDSGVAKKRLITTNEITSPIFQQIAFDFEKHQEDKHVDFYIERNIPFMLSQLGPKAAVGDVNGDGLDDIFIGGAVQQPRQLYLQTPKGFEKRIQKDFETYTFTDVTVAFFFDADGDGDLDLFTGGGGNFAAAGSNAYQNMIFLNDGKGQFTLKPGALPMNLTNCGAAIPLDFDNDGHMDIFIGNRSEAQQYGIIPKSYLFRNNGDASFTDVTSTVAPAFQTLGMITAIAWADITGDGKNNLLVTGEWMNPKLFEWKNNQFSELSAGLENYSGWWQTMAVADLDKDGDLDLVFGNLGENFYLRPDPAHPAKLWVDDFDGNGALDKLLSQHINGKDYPVFMKRDITDQMPSLKANNLRHREFASKTVQELLNIKTGNKKPLEINYASSAIAWNDGKGRFTMSPLPMQVQLSATMAIAISDVNNDGLPDIIAAGNRFDLLPQFCRLDAGYGNILLNKGNQQFEWLTPQQSGLLIKGAVRDIQRIVVNGNPHYLFLQNNDYPLFYKPTIMK